DEKLLAFDHERTRWSWDLSAIDTKRYTNNVVDLLTERLTRLAPDTQDALRQFACLGNVAEVEKLSIVLRMPEDQVNAVLASALDQHLIDRVAGSYQFVHDRVQEACYALVPEDSRAELHLRIGRLLVAQTPPETRDDAIFEVVSQLNRGVPLITSPEEREEV